MQEPYKNKHIIIKLQSNTIITDFNAIKTIVTLEFLDISDGRQVPSFTALQNNLFQFF